MTNLGGWLFLLAAFVCFYVFCKKNDYSKQILIAGFIAILAHHVLSALNVIYGPFPFAQLDAHSFHLHGIQRVDIPETKVWSIGSNMYKSLLGTVYSIFGKDRWMGQTFSILFFAFSCMVLIRIAKRYELNSFFCALTLLLFGFIPSSLLYGSFTLRETFFICFFMLGVYLAYQAIFLNESAKERTQQWQYFVMAVVAFVLMGIFHMVLLIYAIALSAALFMIIYAQRASWQKTLLQFCVCVIVVAALIFFVKNFFSVHISDNYFAMLRIQINGEVIPIPHAISVYHQSANATGAATQYDASLEFTTWGRMFFVFIYSYFFYLGWAVTGDYSQLSTWVIMSEAILRLAGIIAMFALLRKNRHWYWLVFVYITLTFLWNIGTSNHGQALRHHFMTEWIPIMAIMVYMQYALQTTERFNWFSRLGKSQND